MSQHIMTIGSIYGEDRWKNLDMLEAMVSDNTLTPTYDKYIFMGNYVKTYWKTQSEILSMITDLISLKQNYPNHIVLLIGSDDLQYMFPEEGKFRREGFHKDIVFFTELYQSLSPYLEILYNYGNTIWTHSGIRTEWASVFGITPANDAASVSTLLKNIELGSASQQYYIDAKHGGKNVASGPLFSDKFIERSDLIEWVNHVMTDDHQSKSYNRIRRTPFLSTVCQLTEHKITDFYVRRLEDSVLIEQYNG